MRSLNISSCWRSRKGDGAGLAAGDRLRTCPRRAQPALDAAGLGARDVTGEARQDRRRRPRSGPSAKTVSTSPISSACGGRRRRWPARACRNDFISASRDDGASVSGDAARQGHQGEAAGGTAPAPSWACGPWASGSDGDETCRSCVAGSPCSAANGLFHDGSAPADLGMSLGAKFVPAGGQISRCSHHGAQLPGHELVLAAAVQLALGVAPGGRLQHEAEDALAEARRCWPCRRPPRRQLRSMSSSA